MFIKEVKANRGQSVVEYLVFFALIAVLTLISLSTFYPHIHRATESAFQEAIGEILE